MLSGAEAIGSDFGAEIGITLKSKNQNRSIRQSTFAGIVSECREMQKIFNVVEKVAKTNSTVLVLGESGTGKELIARALHKLSQRSGRLVPVNCGAIPEDILESELFGHEKGSFTGAIANRIGRFQMADGGTIFLDEIGEMSPKLQVKLLRVLQERKVEPVGSARSVDIDVRVIAATNKDLREEVKAGRFREDLYYRLQVVPIELPALRNRGSQDLMLLANFFLERACNNISRTPLAFSKESERLLINYPFPGNVRELENLMERLAILCESDEVQPHDLPEYWHNDSSSKSSTLVSQLPDDGVDFNDLIEQYESSLICLALEKTNGNKKAAARLLNLNRTTLVEKIKKKGLHEGKFANDLGEDDEQRPEL